MMVTGCKTWLCDVGEVIVFRRPRRNKRVVPAKLGRPVPFGWRIAATSVSIVATVLFVFRFPVRVGLAMLGGIGIIGGFFTWLLTEPTNWQGFIHCAVAFFGSIVLWHGGEMVRKYMQGLAERWSFKARTEIDDKS